MNPKRVEGSYTIKGFIVYGYRATTFRVIWSFRFWVGFFPRNYELNLLSGFAGFRKLVETPGCIFLSVSRRV